MNDNLPPCPRPPTWVVDWDGLNTEYTWLERLRGCPQDPEFHGEGDVWTHTRLVCEAMAAMPAWRTLPQATRSVLFAAAMLHDVGKPDCTKTGTDGRLTSPGHALRGSILARRILWGREVPFAVREQVTALVRNHMRPFYLIDRPDPRRLVAEISQTARCDHLAILAEADARGRIAPDQQRLLDNVALFAECCRDHACFDGPLPFASDHTRFLFFQGANRDPEYAVHEDFRAEVVLTSGLPGSGKDHWVRENLADWPVISLDALRAQMDVSPAESQGAVVNRARELAREHLRRGESFVWNATNVSRVLRRQCIELFADYRARVRIVYLEVPERELYRQNRQRRAVVPEAVIEGMLDRWEVPDLTEAHRVDWVVRDA